MSGVAQRSIPKVNCVDSFEYDCAERVVRRTESLRRIEFRRRTTSVVADHASGRRTAVGDLKISGQRDLIERPQHFLIVGELVRAVAHEAGMDLHVGPLLHLGHTLSKVDVSKTRVALHAFFMTLTDRIGESPALLVRVAGILPHGHLGVAGTAKLGIQRIIITEIRFTDYLVVRLVA